MILVDIHVLSINKQYDFKLDENAYIADILEEVGEMMISGDENLLLCDYEGRRILPLHQSLKQCGIGNGCRLVLL